MLCAAQEFMTPDFKKQWFRKKAHELPADAELVSCVPLSLVLEMFGISHIDFLSLDVEVMRGTQSVLHWGVYILHKHVNPALMLHLKPLPGHCHSKYGGVNAVQHCTVIVIIMMTQ